ncbi:MAG: uridylate kinase [Parcubacteria group bacterium]|nr:uridylate kinase [Parcubacteria group bacterium]
MGGVNFGERTNRIVISLGGSLISPHTAIINTKFIVEFKKVIARQVNLGKRFIIVCGGGNLARAYQNAYKMIASKVNNDTADLMGIKATKLNAQLVAGVFGDLADQRIIDNPNKKILTENPVIFAGGWKPKCSTDLDAILFAINVGARRVINITNTDGIYNKDPNGKDGKSAKLIKHILWGDYKAMIPKKWIPGLSSPFDPIASRKAEKNDIEVVIIGQDLTNLKLCLEGKRFKGTTISGPTDHNLYQYIQNFKKRRLHRTEGTFLSE